MYEFTVLSATFNSRVQQSVLCSRCMTCEVVFHHYWEKTGRHTKAMLFVWSGCFSSDIQQVALSSPNTEFSFSLHVYLWRGLAQYTLCLKLEWWQVHLCQHFWDSFNLETSSLLLSFKREAPLVALGPTHPSPFTDSSSPKAPLRDCQGGRGAGRRGWDVGREGRGWNSPSCQSPSKQTHAKAPCVYKQSNWIRLDVYSGLIWAKPNTLWAIKGNGWVIGTLSFSANANTSITLHHFKLYKSKSGWQGGKINTTLCDC